MTSKTKLNEKELYWLQELVRCGFMTTNNQFDKNYADAWIRRGLAFKERVGNGTNNRNHIKPTKKLIELLQ